MQRSLEYALTESGSASPIEEDQLEKHLEGFPVTFNMCTSNTSATNLFTILRTEGFETYIPFCINTFMA